MKANRVAPAGARRKEPVASGDAVSTRDHTVRVISIYATPWRHRGQARPAHEEFELGWLREFHDLYRAQLPRVLVHEPLSPADVLFAPAGDDGGGQLPHQADWTMAESWLFVLPFDEVVAALTVEFRSPDLNVEWQPTVSVLEMCAYAQVRVRGADLAEHIAGLARRGGAERIDAQMMLPPERHHVVFAREFSGRKPPTDEVVKRVLYRIAPPFREEFMPVERPLALNQERGALGAVTPYVSLLYGHQEYVENSIFLTVVQAVGTAARFRQIWSHAYRHVRSFRVDRQAQKVGMQRREDLEDLVDEMGNLELDLSFSVETSADLGLLIPSLRIESFHRALYRVMEVPTRAETVSKMFSRLDGSVRSEITAIEIRERREEERKQLRRAAAFSVASVVAVPIGFVLTFFGVHAREVEGQLSMFDMGHYRDVYVAAAALAILPLVAFLALYSGAFVSERRDSRGRARRRARAAGR